MSQSKFSQVGLDRLHGAMAGYVERHEVPGIVTLVASGSEVHVDAAGVKATDTNDPVRRDTIFRISSMTKPITAAAAMILIDDGKLDLDEPVDRLLPELASRKVLKRIDGPLDETVPAKRAITVRDLLTFRLGFGVILAAPDSYPIQKAVTELRLGSLGPPVPLSPPAPDEWIRRFATLPLMHQPGECWMYNAGAHVLGVLIARAAGQPLDAFFHQRIFEPLGMKDTGFSVPPAKLDRLATSYFADPKTHGLTVNDGVRESQWGRAPAFPDGAAGLVSTVDDYLAFGQMMLNQGEHRGARILSKRSVEAMTRDQLTPEQKAASAFTPGFWETYGWGLGLAVVTQKKGTPASPGTYGWDGGLGTSWWADPQAGILGILMTQRAWPTPHPPDVQQDFWNGVYGAIEA